MTEQFGAATGVAMLSRRQALGLGLGLTATIVLGGRAAAASTKIKFWDAGLFTVSRDGILDKQKSFAYRIVEAFKAAHPEIEVELTVASGDITSNSNQFRAASIAKNGPDVKNGYAGGNVLSFAQFIEPLDDVFSPEEQANITGWQTVRAGYKTDGSILALPFGAGSYFYIFYRPSLFKQAGVEFSAPQTWEDLLAMAEKLKAGGVNPFWTCNQEGYLGAWVIAALAGGQIGPNAFTEMVQGNIRIDDPGMVEAYKAYAELFSRGLTNPDAGQVGNGEAVTGFAQGKGAMLVAGGWSNSELIDTLGDDVEMFAIPTLASAKAPGVLAGGPNVAVFVTNYSANKEAAFTFLRFLAEASSIDLYVELTQTEASNHADANAALITNRLLRAQAEQIKTASTVYPFDNVMPQPVIDLFYRVNATVFTGAQTAEDAVAQLQAEFERQTQG